MPDQYRADVTMLSPNDSGRRTSRPSLIIVHTNEGPANSPVANLLGWLQQPRSQASYTMVVDGAGNTGRCNDDEFIPWAAGSPANERGLHLCLQGYAAATRDEWLRRPLQLDAAAEVAADWCRRYDIPAGKLTGAQMRAGVAGIGGHDTTVQAWHSTDHTDPGAGFPWDDFIRRVLDKLSGTTDSEDDDMAFTDADRRKLDYIYGQLRPWPQLGTNDKGEPLTLVDAVAEMKAAGK